MKHILSLLSIFFICITFSTAQTDGQGSVAPRQYLSPLEVKLEQEESEVQYYKKWLGELKAAYQAKDMGKVASYESAVLMSLRNEINQLELKIDSEAAQTERRKSAYSGQLTPVSSPDEAPARDPLAEAVTPDEIRLETMKYTLAAFDRHAFDPGTPEVAARDFAKLDKIQVIMEEALAELKAIFKK
ncbi:MAG: hypothetical protein JNJ57_10210 [Saprospiraceae bacterium]|nr:hypothetical protein [Saprospiraceae bacterium]